MMTHDPFQTLANTGAYPGMTTPFGLPYGALQNPAILQQLAANPNSQQGYGGIPGIGAIHPHHLQLASLLAAQGGNPYAAWQNPWFNPTTLNPTTLNAISGQQNPYQQFGQQGQFGQHGQFGQQGQQNPMFGQQQNPYQQWGQQGQYGQQNPLLHAILAQQWQNPNQQFGQQNPMFGQQQNPYQQLGQQGQCGQGQFGQTGQFGQQGQQNPLNAMFAQQNPYQQLGQQGQYGQFGQQGQQNPLNPMFGQQQNPYQQLGQQGQYGQSNPLLHAILAQQLQSSPYQQFGQPSQFGQQGQLGQHLAPQTWIGTSPFLNPLAQLAARGIQGSTPWMGV